MATTILNYQTPQGAQPAAAFVATLEGEAKVRAYALITLLSEQGAGLRLPHSRSLGEGLFELRDVSTGVRLFYMFLPKDRAVILDGLTKKRDDIPDSVLKRLRKMREDILQAEKATHQKGR